MAIFTIQKKLCLVYFYNWCAVFLYTADHRWIFFSFHFTCITTVNVPSSKRFTSIVHAGCYSALCCNCCNRHNRSVAQEQSSVFSIYLLCSLLPVAIMFNCNKGIYLGFTDFMPFREYFAPLK